MNDTTPDSLIPYDDIVQDALRGVVSRVLQRISDEGGLPGGHHFYIAFRTRAPGVSIPKHLMERYPDEMTIVIQHRYWDLIVADDHFSIGLSFNQMPSSLVIPYDAIVGFVELSRAGQIVSNQIFQPLLVFGVVGVIYFALCWPLSLLAGRLA